MRTASPLARRLLIVLAVALSPLLARALPGEDEDSGAPPPRVVWASDDAEVAGYLARGPQPGDVLVLAAGHYGRLVFDRPGAVAAEAPVTIVGEAFYARHLADRAGEAPVDGAALLRRLPGPDRRGARQDAAALTPLGLDGWTFRRGAWAVAGFDIEATSGGRHLINADVPRGGAGSFRFVHNRLSNCTAPDACLWDRTDADGNPVNGGVLLMLNGGTAGAEVRDNVFEDIRGFLVVSVANADHGSVIRHNTFRRLWPWAANAGEAIQIGSVQPVPEPDAPPEVAPTRVLVADNVFREIHSDGEIVSVKSGGNVLRGNLFADSPTAGLSLRDGADTLVEDNEVVRSIGIRVMGERQTIRGNLVLWPRDGWGIWLENGAGRAGYFCAARRRFWQSPPLYWRYRAPVGTTISGNRVVVAPGEEERAIAVRQRDKTCFSRGCGDEAGVIECDRAPSAAELAAILLGTGNMIEVAAPSVAPDRGRGEENGAAGPAAAGAERDPAGGDAVSPKGRRVRDGGTAGAGSPREPAEAAPR